MLEWIAYSIVAFGLFAALLIPIYIICAIVVGWVARQKLRSFLVWFVLSLIITPLLSTLALIAVPARETQSKAGALVIAALLAWGLLYVYRYEMEHRRTAAAFAPAPASTARQDVNPARRIEDAMTGCETRRTQSGGYDYRVCPQK
jgi:hypothetical protein